MLIVALLRNFRGEKNIKQFIIFLFHLNFIRKGGAFHGHLYIYIICVTLNTELSTLWCSGVFSKTTHLSKLPSVRLESPAY